jgi:hypothetical protein
VSKLINCKKQIVEEEVSYLDGGEDPSQGTGSEEEDGDGRELAGVTLAVVGDGLDHLADHNHRYVGSLQILL